ncbi:hypothetical protein EPN29_02735 [bacterium]|nr:MAG: hypothetical protein EPN29_02735 [bacterium]
MKRILARAAGSLGAAALVLVAFAGPVAAALPPAPAGVVVSGSPSNLESGDGNMTVDFSTLGVNDTDWNCFTIGPTANCKTTTGAQFITADSSGEIQWVNGQKFDTLCPATSIGNNPPKDEFVNIAQFSEADASLNEFFYGATIRATNTGNASGDVEFDHNKGANPTSLPCRVAGDILMAYDFLNGGTSLNFHLLTWIDSSNPNAGGNTGTCFVKTDSLPCWGSNVIIPSGAVSNGASNQSPIAAADNGMSGVALPINQFSEFGINLSKALGISGQCLSFPQQTWESRSSGSSFTSNPQDLEITQRTINNCGEVKIIKRTDPRGQNATFSYTSNLSGGQMKCTQSSPTSFSLNDSGNSTSDSAANTQDCTFVPAGNYSVSEGTPPSGFTFEKLSCSVSGTGTSATTSGVTATITLAGSGLVTCVYTNQLNTATMSTQVSTTSSVLPSQAVHDTATVTGNQAADTPMGTVSFFLCGPIATGSCGSGGTSIGSGTLSGSGATASASSPDVNTSASPLGVGRYCFRATWPGDTNYPAPLTEFGGTNGTNECFTVIAIPTTTKTTPSAGSGGTTTFGSSVTDHAVVQATQTGDGTPTGTVTFFICNPTQTSGGACPSPNGAQVGSGPVTLSAVLNSSPPASSADSVAITANMTGTWCFRAEYTPGGANGANYTASSDATSGECFTVTDTSASASAQDWLPNDTATVTATNGAPLNGTLSAQLFTDNACGGNGGSAVSGQLYQKTLTNATSVADRTLTTSNTTDKITTSTSVSWLVKFTSTDSNVTSTSHCEVTTLSINN